MFDSEQQAADWLSGIIDGEGSITKRPLKGRPNGYARDVRITNTDLALLAHVREALTLLGVSFREYDRSEYERLGSKPIFDIVIARRENLQRLQEVLTLRSRKAEQLQELVNSYFRPPMPSRSQVEGWVAAGKSDREIGVMLGVTPGAAWYWRRVYDIVRP